MACEIDGKAVTTAGRVVCRQRTPTLLDPLEHTSFIAGGGQRLIEDVNRFVEHGLRPA
jgi:hypothetical protein